MELETIPYAIAFRPGSSNQVPDYLSRTPGLVVDEEINEESLFEDRIYPIESSEVTGNWDTTEQLETTDTEEDTDGQAAWVKLLSAEQHKDRVIREAKDQLTQTGKVQRG